MEKNTVLKNFLYNLFYQFLVIGLPFFVTPYLTRVLGPANLGINGYANSIASFFTIIAIFGISAYGSREIAYIKQNEEARASKFWSIFITRVVISLVAIILYLLFVSFFENEYKFILYIYIITLISTIFDITWLFIGLEDFKKIVSRNTIMRIISTILIFAFVNDDGDLYIYILINVITMLLGNLLIWTQIPKVINRGLKLDDIKNIKVHILPAFSLFLPHFIIQIYAQLDKYILSFYNDMVTIGLYDQAQRLLVIILSIITSLSTVLSPKVAESFANNDIKRVRLIISTSLNFCLYLSIPFISGIISISNTFPLWFFGKEFSGITPVIVTMSPMILFVNLGSIFGFQLLVQIGKQKWYTYGILFGAITSLILNNVLGYYFGAIGAAITKVITEAVVAFTFIILSKNYIEFNNIKEKFMKYSISSIFMFVTVYPIGMIGDSDIYTILIQCLVGFLVYIFTLSLLKDQFHQQVIYQIKKKLQSRN